MLPGAERATCPAAMAGLTISKFTQLREDTPYSFGPERLVFCQTYLACKLAHLSIRRPNVTQGDTRGQFPGIYCPTGPKNVSNRPCQCLLEVARRVGETRSLPPVPKF